MPPLSRDKYFRLPRDLEALTQPIGWVIYPFIPVGVMNMLGGQQKTSGKTTWTLNQIKQVVTGGKFLGQAVKQGAVVQMQEMPLPSLVEGVKQAGLQETEDFHIWLWSDHFDKNWERSVATVVQKAINLKAVWLIVDTFPAFALAPKGISENDAGMALNALRPLTRAIQAGINVTLIRHSGAGKGKSKDVAGSMRGSTAYSGAADVITHIVKPGRGVTNAANQIIERHVHCLGRFSNHMPELTKVVYHEGEYYNLSEFKAESKTQEFDPSETILAYLPGTLKSIHEASGIPESSLKRMLSRADIVTSGNGRRGSPLIYKLKEST